PERESYHARVRRHDLVHIRRRGLIRMGNDRSQYSRGGEQGEVEAKDRSHALGFSGTDLFTFHALQCRQLPRTQDLHALSFDGPGHRNGLLVPAKPDHSPERAVEFKTNGSLDGTIRFFIWVGHHYPSLREPKFIPRPFRTFFTCPGLFMAHGLAWRSMVIRLETKAHFLRIPIGPTSFLGNLSIKSDFS